jgi:CheY-like chemotaxis protein
LKRCILVVEDNQLNRELLRELEVEGYEVRPAADSKAYEVFSRRLPDAVLLDFNRGKDNGLDLLAWMRPTPELESMEVGTKPAFLTIL